MNKYLYLAILHFVLVMGCSSTQNKIHIIEKEPLNEDKHQSQSYDNFRDDLRAYVLTKGWERNNKEKSSNAGKIINVVPVKLINRVSPKYPDYAAYSCTEGDVKLKFTIRPSGSVKDISVLESNPNGVFDRAAINALSHWSFEPKKIEGRKVEQIATQTLSFRVNKSCFDRYKNSYNYYNFIK